MKTIESKVETSFKGEDIGRRKTDVESKSEAATLGFVLTDNSIAESFGLGSHDGVCVCGICLPWEVWRWRSCLKDRSCQVYVWSGLSPKDICVKAKVGRTHPVVCGWKVGIVEVCVQEYHVRGGWFLQKLHWESRL